MLLDNITSVSTAREPMIVPTEENLSPWMREYLAQQISVCESNQLAVADQNPGEASDWNTPGATADGALGSPGDPESAPASTATLPHWEGIILEDTGAKDGKHSTDRNDAREHAHATAADEVSAAMFGSDIEWAMKIDENFPIDPDVDQFLDWDAILADSFSGEQDSSKDTAAVAESTEETPLPDISMEASLDAYLAHSPKAKKEKVAKAEAPQRAQRPLGRLGRLAKARERKKEALDEMTGSARCRTLSDGAVVKPARGRASKRGLTHESRRMAKGTHVADVSDGDEHNASKSSAGQRMGEEGGDCDGAYEEYVRNKEQMIAKRSRARSEKEANGRRINNTKDRKQTQRLQVLIEKQRPVRRIYKVEKRTPSRSCHVCCGHRSSGAMAVCSNVVAGTCRKVVCARCFTSAGLGGGKAFAAACVDPT